jgi:hypothetical protein
MVIVNQDKTMNSVLSGFSGGPGRVSFAPTPGDKTMFAFDRSALAVLLPLALLVAVVLYSNQAPEQSAQTQTEPSRTDQAVAANLPSR